MVCPLSVGFRLPAGTRLFIGSRSPIGLRLPVGSLVPIGVPAARTIPRRFRDPEHPIRISDTLEALRLCVPPHPPRTGSVDPRTASVDPGTANVDPRTGSVAPRTDHRPQAQNGGHD